jgi:YVTN family beta-propeller protein
MPDRLPVREAPRRRRHAPGWRIAGAGQPTSGPGLNGRAQAIRVTRVWAVLGLSLVACSLHQAGVNPPDNRIFFPAGGIVAPEGRFLYVVNSNSDLRYNAGTVLAVDLSLAAMDLPSEAEGRQRWADCSTDPSATKPLAHAQCCWDVLDSHVLNCDERSYIRRDATVRIGSFAGRPVFQHLAPGSAPVAAGIGQRMFVPVRGNGSVTMLDVAGADAAGPRLYCTGVRTAPNQAGFTQPTFATCEAAWMITRADDPAVEPQAVTIPDNEILLLPDEAYALAVDDALVNPLLYVGHLRSGAVSLVYLGNGEDAFPELLGVNGGVLPPDGNGSRGMTSLTIRNPAECGSQVFATSRFRNVASSFVVSGINGADCGFVPSPGAMDSRTLAIIAQGNAVSTGIPGSETRGIEFIAGKALSQTAPSVTGDVAFLLQRNPPALVALDANTNIPFATLEMCQGPLSLAQQTVHGVPAGLDGPTLFVTCFDSGEVYVVDATVPRVKAIIPVGRGPVYTLFDDTDPTRGYVVGFGGNNVSVLDLDPASPTSYRVIQRIGYPSATPRETDPL